MPEGDVVFRACYQLNQALGAKVLTRCEFRVPTLATTDLTGVEVLEVLARGKHQLFRFGNGFTLHSHFRMEGAWRIYPVGRQWTGGQDWQIRGVLGTDEHSAVGYRLPVLELLPTADEDSVVGHLGPDLLGPDWDLDEAIRRMERHPETSIGEALLDQRNLAGIGTFYRAEILFLQGIHPRTRVADVPDLRRLVIRAQKVLAANRWQVAQTTTGNVRPGARAYVFERVNQPCRRCRTPIRSEEFGPTGQERRSYWCPHCQPAAT